MLRLDDYLGRAIARHDGDSLTLDWLPLHFNLPPANENDDIVASDSVELEVLLGRVDADVPHVDLGEGLSGPLGVVEGSSDDPNLALSEVSRNTAFRPVAAVDVEGGNGLVDVFLENLLVLKRAWWSRMKGGIDGVRKEK